jgi:long-chain fatty acid transport protein
MVLALCGLMIPGLMTGQVRADGFRNPPEGGAALGRAGARLTEADDATAVTHNPANLADLEAAVLTPALTIGYRETTFKPAAGGSETSESPWRLLPALYGAWPVKDGACVLGLGLSLPYGQATEWDENGVFKYAAPHFAEMLTLNLSPTVAFKAGSKLSVGVGLDLVWSDLEFRQNLPWFPPPAGLAGPGSLLKFEGDGYAVGAHAGLTYSLTDNQRLALVYRSPFSVTYEGDFTIGNPPPPGSLPPGVTTASDFETELEFPSIVALGYGLQVTETLRVEANVEWMEHSRNKAIDLDIGNNNALLLGAIGTTSLPQDWDDTWVVALGADWACRENVILRAGWTHIPTPVPTRNLMSTLPEADSNIFSVGVGLAGELGKLDIAYALNVMEDRTVSDNINPALNGEYETDAHLLTLSYLYEF